jgi:hypothetical protein
LFFKHFIGLLTPKKPYGITIPIGGYADGVNQACVGGNELILHACECVNGFEHYYLYGRVDDGNHHGRVNVREQSFCGYDNVHVAHSLRIVFQLA